MTFSLPTPTGTAGDDLLRWELSDSGLPASESDGTADAPATTQRNAWFVPDDPPDKHEAVSSHTDVIRDTSTAIAESDWAPEDPLAERDRALPGSRGEHLLQSAYGTQARAEKFYEQQMLDHLNEKMISFVRGTELAFMATSDASGECDCSLRAGPAGFIQVIDERTIACPEYRGNGVLASLGNISENPRIGVLLVDFVTDLIGLHINGHAAIVEDAVLRAEHPDLVVDDDRGRTPQRWVKISVVEAYIHCRKHIPRLVPVDDRTRSWGSDEPIAKGGDYFAAKGMPRPWHQPVPASR